MKNRLIILCLSVVISLALPCVAQTHYQPIDLGVLPGDSYSTDAGVNDQTHVTGTSGTSANLIHGFLWKKNKGMTDLGTLGGNNSYPESINDADQIVGGSDLGATASDAFLWQNGTMTDIGSLGAQDSVANAINFDPQTNSFTQIAGWSPTSDNSAVHAVIWDASLQITDLGTLPGGSYSIAWGNNCAGQVVGQSDTTNNSIDAILWGPGIGMVDLGTLGGTWALAAGINCSGQIVGWSKLPGDAQVDAFVYLPNVGMKDIGNLGGSVSHATAINKAGQVVGFSYLPGDADTHAFVWTATGGLKDLNKLIPPNSGWELQVTEAISNNGRISGTGTINGAAHAFVLIPK